MCVDKTPVRLFCILLSLSALIFYGSCKKSPTVPQIDDASRPVIWLSRSSLFFAASDSGGNPASQTLTIKNTGPGTLDYTIETDADWATISPPAGSSTSQEIEHTISVKKTGLAPGENAHKATLTIICSQAYNNPQQAEITFYISKGEPPKIWVESPKFTFNAQEGGPDPSVQGLRIKNEGQGRMDYELIADVPWIDIHPSSGSSTGALKVHNISTHVAGLATGIYTGKITISCTNASNNPKSVDVTLKVDEDQPPAIGVSTKNIALHATQGGSNPSPRSFSVWNSGGGSLKYTIDCDAAWLSVTPASGQSGGAERDHSLFADISGLGAGSYQGLIQISAPGASNTPQNLNVSLSISNPSADNAISLSCSPSSAKTNDIISFLVKISGNFTSITVFGLEMTYDSSIFRFHSIAKGSLTGNWMAVDGNEISPGTIKIGGFAGAANPIPISSEGTIVIVRLKVISTSSNNRQTNIWIKNYIDDIQGMKPSSATTNFTYLK